MTTAEQLPIITSASLPSNRKKMIEVNSNKGWMDYCHACVESTIVDMNGTVLYTGDIVEVLDSDYYNAGIEDCRVGSGMVIFDEFKNFLGHDKFFVEGWLSASVPDKYLFRKINNDPRVNSHYRIKVLS